MFMIPVKSLSRIFFRDLCKDACQIVATHSELRGATAGVKLRRQFLEFHWSVRNGLSGAVHRVAVSGDATHFISCKEAGTIRSSDSQGASAPRHHHRMRSKAGVSLCSGRMP